MRHLFLFTTCVLLGITCVAQTVSNARFEQVGKTIKIYYDLSEKADISIYLSTDGGQTYESSPLTNVSGDVGKDVSAGRDKKAVWDVLASRERLQGNKVCFKVRAAWQGSNRTIRVDGVSFTMVYVAGGTFTMGCTSEQGGDCYSDEKPSHRVTLSGYYIGETEVTQQLWQAVMGSNPSCYKGEQRPVDRVSWYDCQDFIRRLNNKTGLHFALPTEAQWEYAARGGSKSRGYKYSGSTNIGSVAWCGGISSSQTHNVKGKQPNELGLYDMSGNVWEWCADGDGSYSSSSQTNPTGPSSGLYRVKRGGSWDYSAWFCRVSYRFDAVPSGRFRDCGLRLVLLP